jgi:predicted aldo/keto reductase-like oxidoreductase
MDKKKFNRRDFLKTLGVGTVATTAALYGCGTKGKGGNDNVPMGKLTYRTNRHTGDKVSLIGYGFMRLPTKKDNAQEGEMEIDQEMVNKLVDYAIGHGVNYYDTSPHYMQGKSEAALGTALKKHPRNKFFVATKMSNFIDPDDPESGTRETSLNMYHDSFKYLQVDTIDYYLLHSIGHSMDEFKARFIDNGILDFLIAERKAGRIRNLGFSFHGEQEVFDAVLNMPVKWDFVQIEMNYLDWKHAGEGNVNADYLYGELLKRNIQAVIMESLRGGMLARLEYHLLGRLKQVHPDDTPAKWAFRYVGSYPNVLTVLSGMTYMENLQENICTYSPLQPLTESEKVVLDRIVGEIEKFPYIGCTGCSYCMPCPYGLNIPGIFAQYNRALDEGYYPANTQDPDYRRQRRDFLIGMDRKVDRERQADHCVNCGACLPKCPQHLEIPTEMQKVDMMMNDLKLQGNQL